MLPLITRAIAAFKRVDTTRAAWRYLVLLGLFVVALAIRLYGIENRSIWMDEDHQARNILQGKFDLSMLARSAEQQQPPLDYYLEYLGFELFGVTPLGARFHAAVLGSLTVLVVYLLLRRVFESRLPVLMGTLLALLHPLMLYYSREGRPIACGVFFAALVLYLLHWFMYSAGSVYLLLLRGALLGVVACGFMLSVGFQPLIFLASAALALTPGLFVSRLRWRALGAMFCLGLGALAALPALLRVIKDGTRYVGRTSPFSRIGGVLGQFSELGLGSWTDKWYELLRHIWPLALVATGLGLAGLMLAFRRRKPLDAQGPIIFLLIFSLVFPALFDATFRALIDYEIKPRYYLTLAPVLILLVVCMSHQAFAQYERLVRGQRHRTLVFRSILTLLVAYTAVLHAERTYTKHTEPGADWERMYALFKKDKTPGTAYMIHLVEPDNKRPGYYSQRFYYTERDVRPVALRLQPDLVSDCQRSSGPLNRASLYFAVRYGWADLKKLRRKLKLALPDAVFHAFPGNSVVHMRPKEPGSKAAMRFFEVLTQHLRRVPESYNAYRGLADLKLCHGDYDGAQAAVDSMRALDPDSRTLAQLARQMDAKIRRAKAGERKQSAGRSTAL